MEGSVAGPAAAQGQGDGGGDAGGAQNGDALAALTQGQAELRDLISGMSDRLEAAPAAADAGADAGDDDGQQDPGWDMGFLDDPDVLADPEQLKGQLQGMIRAEAQAIAQQAMAPLQAQIGQTSQAVQDQARQQELAALHAEIPELADEAIFKPIYDATKKMGEVYGWDPALADDPRMWRLTYFATRALEAAAEEGDGTDLHVATLEGGGGARPAGVQQGQDLGDAIVGAGRKGKSALPFG